MRSFLLVFLMPFYAMAGEDSEAPVMYASCQCEIWSGDGLFVDARNNPGGLPGMPSALSPYIFAQGTYTLDMEASNPKHFNEYVEKDKKCTVDDNGVGSNACLNAMAWAKMRATGDCRNTAATQYSSGNSPGVGMLVPRTCMFQLNGENIELSETLMQLL